MVDWRQEIPSREELELLQLERLQSTLNRAYRQVKFYRRLFDRFNLRPDDIQDLAEVSKLPFTTRSDLSENYPYGMFAVPLRDIVRIQSSPGATENPVVVGCTAGDLRFWRELSARLYRSAGVGKDDIVQIILASGLNNWARDLKDGAEHLGASVIPASNLNFAKQLMVMRDYKTSVLVTTPSYAHHLVSVMDKMGLMAADLHLRRALLVAEPLPSSVRAEIEAGLQVSITTAYGITEVLGPGLAFSCPHSQGFHFSEDHFLPEIIDPKTGAQCSHNTTGELVLTTLSAVAFPLLRFRTGDLTELRADACPCGCPLIRLGDIVGRCDPIFSVGGIKIHPQQISTYIQEIVNGHTPRHQLHLKREEALAYLEIDIEVDETLFSDEVKCLEAIGRRLRRRLRQNFGIEARVSLVEKISAT
ncbi:phenylacetate--CoA ligase family protein [Desulfobacca acetoxidans]|uniref:Phenylacetate-coenzyme A ligase n=1 Tax=Desulfobacca acetoxidans (strain ATCC 700848 / DSM 11109 / ASRB2) TaxID=880072 RepID=F2NI84_DESAR|nr:AMP-binding protein [Desulfobacca acetoxidans]AEB09853.1 Phenylacetate--CoA ligase [Desulfobacca acetoxidans DSM 11109]